MKSSGAGRFLDAGEGEEGVLAAAGGDRGLQEWVSMHPTWRRRRHPGHVGIPSLRPPHLKQTPWPGTTLLVRRGLALLEAAVDENALNTAACMDATLALLKSLLLLFLWRRGARKVLENQTAAES